jgi:adenylate kinase family enzyme
MTEAHKMIYSFIKFLLNKFGYQLVGERPIYIVDKSNSGKIVEFIGPSGAGKTTLIQELKARNLLNLEFKKVIPSDNIIQFNRIEILTFLELFNKPIQMGNIKIKHFNSFYSKFLLNRFLINFPKSVLLDEGLFKLRLTEIITMDVSKLRILLKNHLFVIFYISEDILVTRLNKRKKIKDLNVERDYRRHIMEYNSAIRVFLRILDMENIKYYLIDSNQDSESIIHNCYSFLKTQIGLSE